MELHIKWHKKNLIVEIESTKMKLGELKETVYKRTGVPPHRQTYTGLYKPKPARKLDPNDLNALNALTLAELGVVLRPSKPVECMMFGDTDESINATHQALADTKNNEVINDLASTSPAPDEPSRDVPEFAQDLAPPTSTGRPKASRRRHHPRSSAEQTSTPSPALVTEAGIKQTTESEHMDLDLPEPDSIRHAESSATLNINNFPRPSTPHREMDFDEMDFASDDDMGMHSHYQFLQEHHRMTRLHGPEQRTIMGLFDPLGPLEGGDIIDSLLPPSLTHARGTFQEAVAEARRSFKLLVTILHNPDSELSQSFILQAFTSPLFLETLESRFVLWHRPGPPRGDHAAQWLHDASSLFSLTQFPFVGVFICSGSQIAVTNILQGDVSVDELVAMLMTAVEVNCVALDSDMARAADDSATTQLLRSQDVEYEAALLADQEREAQEEQLRKMEEERQRELKRRLDDEEKQLKELQLKQEKEAQYKAAQLEMLRAETLRNLPDEPESSDKTATRIQVRLGDGSRLTRRFPSTSTVQVILDYLFTEKVDVSDSVLVCSLPRKVYSDVSVTLADSGLHPAASLFLEKRSSA